MKMKINVPFLGSMKSRMRLKVNVNDEKVRPRKEVQLILYNFLSDRFYKISEPGLYVHIMCVERTRLFRLSSFSSYKAKIISESSDSYLFIALFCKEL